MNSAILIQTRVKTGTELKRSWDEKINIALPNMNAWNIQQQSTSIKFHTLIKSNNYLHNEVDAIFEEAILFFDVKPN